MTVLSKEDQSDKIRSVMKMELIDAANAKRKKNQSDKSKHGLCKRAAFLVRNQRDFEKEGDLKV